MELFPLDQHRAEIYSRPYAFLYSNHYFSSRAWRLRQDGVQEAAQVRSHDPPSLSLAVVPDWNGSKRQRHYWTRKLRALDHTVKLIAPQFVKLDVKTNQIRGWLSEFGLIVPQGISHVYQGAPLLPGETKEKTSCQARSGKILAATNALRVPVPVPV